MFINSPLPSVEWDHDKSCYAEAVIAAVQNLRDDESIGRFDFAMAVQGGGHETDLKNVAIGYLLDGTMTCTCRRTCKHGLPPWECRPAIQCDRCNRDDLFGLTNEQSPVCSPCWEKEYGFEPDMNDGETTFKSGVCHMCGSTDRAVFVWMRDN